MYRYQSTYCILLVLLFTGFIITPVTSSSSDTMYQTVMNSSSGDINTVITNQLESTITDKSKIPTQLTSVTFIVTSLADSPDDSIDDGIFAPQTLRAAIENANITPGPDIISFAPGITSLSPQSALPTITDPVHISNIILDGILITPLPGIGQYGLAFVDGSSGSTAIGIEILNFPDAGMFIGSNNVTVQGCYLHDNDGPGVLGNAVQNCTIGGLGLLEANYVYSNNSSSGDGIQLFTDIFDNTSDSNTIIGNYIGTSDGFLDNGNERSGIEVWGNYNRITRNIVSGNNYDGIRLGDDSNSPSTGNMIDSNTIGLTVDRSDTLPNGIGNNGEGIYIRYSESDTIFGNVIGGNVGNGIEFATSGNRAYIHHNLLGVDTLSSSLFGNGGSGMFLRGNANLIEHNYASGNLNGVQLIGDSNIVKTNVLGTDDNVSFTNTVSGIQVSGDYNIVGGPDSAHANICSGNSLYGITIAGMGSTGNLVQHNMIGTTALGALTIPNKRDGIRIVDSVQGTKIMNNLILGNDSSGVLLTSVFGRRPRGTLIEDNTIGDPINLTAGNKLSGILLDGAVETYIGNQISGKGNYIRANWYHGIEIRNADSTIIFGDTILSHGGTGIVVDSGFHNHIQGCVIGLNAFHGIYIDKADSTFIYRDTISYNGANGVTVVSGRFNQFYENAIHNNGLLGIDLANDSVTVNDVGDVDSGPNDLLNYPFITSVTTIGDTLVVNGEVDGDPFSTYYIDMYANFACDSTGYGEGQEWIDSVPVTAGSNGIAVIDFKTASPYNPTFSNLTFTSTDLDGNTSEFSPCFTLILNTADIEVTNLAEMDTVMVDDTIRFTITVTNNGPETATGTTIIDTVSTGMTYVSDSTTQGNCSIVNDVLTCTIGTLGPAASATITLVTVADSIGPITNTVHAAANESDQVPQNNISPATIEIIDHVTDVSENDLFNLPTAFTLRQNYPNPFNPSTVIEYALPEGSNVSISVFNLLGQEITTIIDEYHPAGYHSVSWNGLNDSGDPVSSGVYMYRIKADNYTATRKMLLLK